MGAFRTAVTATRLGAFDFLEKPGEGEVALRVVRDALARVLARRPARSALDRIVGVSASIREVRAQVGRAAALDTKVLLLGETGTGKELAARAIHAAGGRRGGPFVAVNCAAIPENLIESEMFGHERGAFTGAVSRRKGRIEQAHRGTLFLDEVGDMSLMTQARVLRVLEDRRIRRVGGDEEIRVDFRLIAATNKELAWAVEQGDFREDLYYRINVLPIHLPPLRERVEDIPPLMEHFLEEASREEGIRPRPLTPGAHRVLMAHDWPGNVRELRNVAERLVLALLAEGDRIDVADVREALLCPRVAEEDPPPALREAREDFERTFIRAALAAHDRRIQETADALGINRSHLWKKMRRLGIDSGETV